VYAQPIGPAEFSSVPQPLPKIASRLCAGTAFRSVSSENVFGTGNACRIRPQRICTFSHGGQKL